MVINPSDDSLRINGNEWIRKTSKPKLSDRPLPAPDKGTYSKAELHTAIAQKLEELLANIQTEYTILDPADSKADWAYGEGNNKALDQVSNQIKQMLKDIK